ncbi:flagella basal body P-ring formation protein FlgA [Streptomyces sp. 1114.5]|uniref:SAF domain-containing protein n=1 Tax=Streptomyces sp. 1114.5 TaxID=1938830 RepID=UPI000F10D30F|nr:SAF domain-containing protein [Streptomyces sp. 1114.5]RKT11777.1 flagella basal body P-ring formation protein FlgA [Streptomyces sp. 1114.5]
MENRTFATPGSGTPAGAGASVALPEQPEQGGGPGKGRGRAAPHAPGRAMRARRRRPAVLAMAVALIAAGGLGGAVLYNSTGQRVAVLALARDVPWGQVITEDDLVVARIASDPALHPLSADERGKAVGLRAATDLKRGALLTGADLAQGLTAQPGQIVVGVSAKRSQLPASRLQPGVQLVVVYTPDNGRADSLPATVITVGRVDTDGSQVIDVAVGTADGPRLAQWVASGRIQVLLAPRGTSAGAAGGGAAPNPAPSGTPAAGAPSAGTPAGGAGTPGTPGAPAATGGA